MDGVRECYKYYRTTLYDCDNGPCGGFVGIITACPTCTPKDYYKIKLSTT